MLFCTKFCKVGKCFRGVVYIRDETGQKRGSGLYNREGNLFHRFFIELLLEHVTVNETGAFGIPPDKGNRVQYFVYTLPFYNQPVYKQTVLGC